MMLPRAIVNLADTALLPSLLAAEVQRCLLNMLRARLGQGGPCNVDYYRGAVANERTMMYVWATRRRCPASSHSQSRSTVRLEDETLTLRAEKRKREMGGDKAQSGPTNSAPAEPYLASTGLTLLDWAVL